MTQTPPCGPDQEDLFKQALEQVQDLLRLTQDIQAQGKSPDLPVLSQLIFQREETLSKLTQLDLRQLPEARQVTIQEMLQRCREMDEGITQTMQDFKHKLDEQIKALKGGQALIGKYKIDNPSQSGTHSEQA